MNWFAAMRCTSQRDFLFGETETVSCSGSDEGNCLMGLCRGTQIRNCLRRAKERGNRSIRFYGYDVAAMPRLCNSTPCNLNQRLSCRHFNIVFRRLPGNLHGSSHELVDDWGMNLRDYVNTAASVPSAVADEVDPSRNVSCGWLAFSLYSIFIPRSQTNSLRY